MLAAWLTMLHGSDRLWAPGRDALTLATQGTQQVTT